MPVLVSATSHERPLIGRQEALRRRFVRNGWILVVAGLLIPFLALWGAGYGWGMREYAPRSGWPLVIAGVTVFAVRLGLYLS